VGLCIAALAVLAGDSWWWRWLTSVLGIWLVLAPTAFHYRGAAWINDVTVGCGLVAIALTAPVRRGTAT
jgi:hypothetical protein